MLKRVPLNEHPVDHDGATPTLTQKSNGQYDNYWVGKDEGQPFVRPIRDSYVHKSCGCVTTMSRAIAETYARDPKFYTSTFCCSCALHLPVNEFRWKDTNETVGS